MSRKTPIRKTKRRLKRSVRRSLAAVLMITAIVIAAVPVPENYADGEETTESTDLHDMEDFGYDASDASDLLGSSVKLDKYANVSADDLIANVGGSYNDVKMSLSMRQMDSGGYEMSWQFMYYTVTISSVTRGIVCKYNNLYLTSELTFPEIMNEEYYTVTTTKYTNYYSTSDSDAHSSALSGMTNSFDPTQSLEYTYNDWNNAYGTNTVINNYFENYYSVNNSSVWNAKITEFETYKKNGGDSAPNALTSIPASDLTEAQKLRFYCDNDTALSKFGSGFTLVSVQNSTPGSSGTIYVAYDDGSATLTTGSTEDDYGFLVKTTSDVVMVGIGDSTFEGVSQVESMTIPNILYIGDDAFSGATMLTSVNLKSVTNIGNRAFKGCTRLASVEMSQAVATIGNECFYNTAITSITLPTALTEIGYGAFADCTKLTTVDLDSLTQGCVIGDYAFYNCSALTSVEMSDAVITSIGAGAFAVASGGAALDITFPQGTSTNCMSSSDSIGNYMFAGRTSLGSVVFPRNYGTSTMVTVPVAMFHGCVNLQYVEFPADETNNLYGGSLAKYEGGARDNNKGVVTTAGLFSDVTNSNFYVKGPKTTSGGAYAYPRTSTWTAVTAVSDVVPYLYVENGVEYYEVSDGDYLLCIDEDGVLTSCTFSPNATSTSSIDLVIPSTVGNTTVTGIASDCFSDDEFNQAVRTLTIEDGGKLSSIEDGAFQGWLKLTTVYIGDSVTSIGDEAFEGCTSLIDVTFASPASGVYTGDGALTIGEDAFATGSSELTFHGDIVEGYAPFEWAMDPDNMIKSGESIRVCYRSLFPTCLTVMYNPNTELVTLLDYPKYDQISDLLNEAYAAQIKAGGYGTYETMMESRYYTAYADSYYDTYRVAFAALWNDTNGDTDAEASAYASDYYGPWINEDFCDDWDNWVSGAPSARTSGGASSGTLASAGTAGQLASHTVNTLLDWLFEPITVYAKSNSPQAYYDKDPYDVIENQVLYAAGDQYRAPTEDESNLIYATQNIVVPAGVGSIDVYGYYKNYTADGSAGSYSNGLNITTYLSGKIWDTDTYKMYISSTAGSDDTETVPGLFSGYYVDYDDTSSEYETATRGNDWITSVTLNSVEYLPDYAFDSCERLQYVILGDDCADIGTSPFRGCYALQTVSNNDYYTTENGIVYSVNTDGSYTIEECLASRGKLVGAAIVSLTNDPNLENVSEIKASAFEDCDYITTVDLSTTAGLATIPEDCFKDCDSLQTVVLPRTVNYIESGAFAGADKLSSLTIYGTEVYIAGDAFEEDTDKVTTTVYAYEDSSAERYVDDNGTVYKLQYSALSGVWTVMFLDAEGQQAADTQYVEDGAYADDPDVDLDTDTWTFTGWLGTNNTLITDKIYENTIFIAQGYSTSGMVNGKYVVEFYDGIDGSQIGSTQYIEPGEDAIAPQAATHTGYTFSKWSDTYTNIQSNKTIMALYTATSGSSSTTTTTTSSSSSATSSTTSSSTSSSTSSTSSETSSTEQYVVTVINGSGSGSYAAGTTVIITANTPASGQVFSKWTTDSTGVTLASVSLSPTTFTMPSNNVTITAEFTDSTASSTAAGTTSTGTATTSTGTGTDSGNTRVDITKPGISNKDLATANVNGSTDNFVIKISETDEATQAVAAALTNKYESLENILYYAMDITLWDSTGTYQLTEAQTEGLTVDITIPIPDALVAYGGNNMAGAVINDNQLENLNENFTTINGVPCIRFTATHFSPYTIYVDTGNLTEGMLDVTPQTGDPIHPKWFLSIGLACLSIILFMKKDKNVTPKTA
ncbi:MAG: leucine-rich repeat protein [Clostridiales bacterium]|nr:leucine-rich repeat protein [Clostridiales bacterium]